MLLLRALEDPRGFGGMNVQLPPDALGMIARFANGDARTALSVLEMAVLNGESGEGSVQVSMEMLEPVSYTHLDVYKRQGPRDARRYPGRHRRKRRYRDCWWSALNARTAPCRAGPLPRAACAASRCV